MKKISLRDIIFYVLILLVLVSVVLALQSAERKGNSATYADLRTLFEQEQVVYFEAEDDEVTLILRALDEDGKNQTVVFPLASFDVFYQDMGELIDRQWRTGVIQDYDYPRGFVAPWWASLIPYAVIILVFGVLWYFLFLRQSGSGGSGGGGAGPARFGRARTRTLSEPDK